MGFNAWQYTAPQYGEPEYAQASQQYNVLSERYGGMIAEAMTGVKSGLGDAKALTTSFAPGGSYGKGQKMTSRELIQEGVARDTAGAVASGMSSTLSARGINVLAGREIGKAYANIEDERARLQLQSFTPYTQMLASLSNLASAGTNIIQAMPKRAQYVTQGPASITGVKNIY